jgi:hypothetical protein
MKTEMNATVTTDNTSSQDAEVFGAYQKFIADTMQYPEKRCRQSAAVVDGLVVGGAKQLRDDFLQHPEAAVGKVAGAAVLGVGVGALAALNKPVVNVGIAATGLALGCAYAYGVAQRLGNDQQLSTALDDVWKYGDPISWKQSLQPIERSLGRESADLVLGTLGGGIGYGAGQQGLSSLASSMRSFEFLRPATAEGLIYQPEPHPLVLFSKGRENPIKFEELPKKLREIEKMVDDGEIREAAQEAFYCNYDNPSEVGTVFWEVSLHLLRAATQRFDSVAYNKHLANAYGRMAALQNMLTFKTNGKQ